MIEPNLESIECDCVAVGVMVKGMVARVVFPSMLLVRGRGLRTGQILWVNNWLRSWYQHQGFRFYDHETLCEEH